VSRRRGDAAGFNPQPGDPWHPDWSLQDDDDAEPTPETDEESSSWLTRLRRGRTRDAAPDDDDFTSSVEEVYAVLRAPEDGGAERSGDPPPVEAPEDAEAAEEVRAPQDLAPPPPDALRETAAQDVIPESPPEQAPEEAQPADEARPAQAVLIAGEEQRAGAAGRDHLQSLTAAGGADEERDLGAELRWVETSVAAAREHLIATGSEVAAASGRKHQAVLGQEAASVAATTRSAELGRAEIQIAAEQSRLREQGARDAATRGRGHASALARTETGAAETRQAAELQRAATTITATRRRDGEQRAAAAGHHIEIDLTVVEGDGEATSLVAELARAGNAVTVARTRQRVAEAAISTATLRPLERELARQDETLDHTALEAELTRLAGGRAVALEALEVAAAARRGIETERRLEADAAAAGAAALAGELRRMAAAASRIRSAQPTGDRGAGAPGRVGGSDGEVAAGPGVDGSGASVAESPVRGWRRLVRRRASVPVRGGSDDQVHLQVPVAAGDDRVRSEVTEASEVLFSDVERAQEDAGVEPPDATLERHAQPVPGEARPDEPVSVDGPGWRIEDFDVPEWSAGGAVSDRSGWEPYADEADRDAADRPQGDPSVHESLRDSSGDGNDSSEGADRGSSEDADATGDAAYGPQGDPSVHESLRDSSGDGNDSSEGADRGSSEGADRDSSGGGDPDDDDDIPDFARYTSEEYAQASTREYAGLAEAVARAAEETPEPMAIAAGMPGLDTGLVGLDDVMDVAGEIAEHGATVRISDLPMRILTGLLLGGIFLASLLHPWAIGLLVLLVLALAVGEFYTVLIRSGRHPLALFGFLGVGGAFFGTWTGNLAAVPVSLLVTTIAVLFFYAVVPGRAKPLENAALTIVGVAWIGGLGAFAFDILDSPDYRWLIGGLVVTVALMDSAQYFVGRRLGRRPLAPVVSPKKTVEGLIGGVLVALAAGAGFGMFEPFDLVNGLVLGAVVAVVAPFGDLAVSVIKRSIGVKDMGTILPGHGGVLDRIDAVLFVIPAAWMAYAWMGLLT